MLLLLPVCGVGVGGMGIYVTEGAWRGYCTYVVLSTVAATSVVALVTE